MRRENNTFIKFDVVHSMVGGAMSGELNGPFTFHDGQIPPTESEIDAEIIRLQAEFDAQEYARSRKAEYPPIEDQQDMQFHDAIDGTTTWQDAIQAVKTKYPKPG